MAKIISVTNQKGGCGKTTTTINLSAILANAGYKVLAIDIDHQADLTKVLGKEGHVYKYSSADLISSNNESINNCIYPAETDGKIIENLFLIPSHITLSRVIEQSVMKAHKEKLLFKHINPISQEYDFILFDCPPNLSLGFMNAVLLSDTFLIPVDGGKFALDGLSDLLDAISEVKEQKIDDLSYHVFRNEFAVNNKLINEFIDEELSNISKHVLNTKIRRSEVIGQASVTSQTIINYSKKSPVVKDYQELCDELISKL